MIDIHSHILPGVDDGAATEGETDEMLRIAAGDGITAMIATPHANGQYEFDPQRCRRLIDELRERNTGMRAYPGCELHLTPENIEKVVREPELYTLNGAGCVLLELPDVPLPSVVNVALETLFGAGLRVIIAHPERYSYIQRKPAYADHLVESGCYLQITAESLGGVFGEAAEKASAHLLRRRLVHMVATDAHHATDRRPVLSTAFEFIVSRYGRSAAETLFVENPHAVLTSKSIQTVRSSRKWMTYFFTGRTYGRGHQASRNLS